MKRVGQILGSLAALAFLFLGAVMVASELGGEVVVLRTSLADGSRSETRLWVVDHDGHGWLRGRDGSSWMLRLEAQPQVVVHRGRADESYTAVPVRSAQAAERINALMREKYGLADHLIGLVRDESVAVRLDPAP